MAAGVARLGPAPARSGGQGLRKALAGSGPLSAVPCRCGSAPSIACSAMAAFPSPARFCPVASVVIELLDRVPRILFLDHEGHISRQPHLLPLAEAQILAANQQQVFGRQARIRVH